MPGDYSRFTFRPERRVADVLMQQGRVQLDADWNEQAEVTDRRIRALAADLGGNAWVAVETTPDAFLLTPLPGPDLGIGTGRLYVDGLLAEAFPGEAWTYLHQPFYPDPPMLPAGTSVAYLELFERELTWVEAPDLLEKALGGVDTAARRQVAWQVKALALENATCGVDLGKLFPPSAGRLTAKATATPKSDDPCILPPTGGYRGLENRLYRVQVHVGGPLATARFKWSRENASIVSPVKSIQVSGTTSQIQVLRIGRDAVLRFSVGDWVEVTDDVRELMGEAGEMARVENVDEASRTLFLDRAIPAAGGRPFGATAADLDARHTRVLRWDQSKERLGNDVGTDGLMATGAFPIPLEDGVQVGFGADPAGGSLQVGDYWLFAARTADGSIEELAAEPPRGVIRHRVQLGVVTVSGGTATVQDCRPLRSACDCCCTLTIGKGGDFPNLAAALAGLTARVPDITVPVRLCFLPGDHALSGNITVSRPDVTLVGCYPRSRLLVRGAPLTLAADRVGVEELVITGRTEIALVRVLGGTGCFLRHNLFRAQGLPVAVQALRALELDIAANRLEGAGIAIGPSCHDVRVRDNDILQAAGPALILGNPGTEGGGVLSEIELCGNRLLQARDSGVVGFGLVLGLRIVGNEILGCVAEGTRPDPEGRPSGGIVLDTAEDVVVRDNRVERNGEAAGVPVAGLFVRRVLGLEVRGNHLLGNGPPPTATPPAGLQGGIIAPETRGAVVSGPSGGATSALLASIPALPALVVEGNTVGAPHGPALLALGAGPMRVQGNSLAAQAPPPLGANDKPGIEQAAWAVLIVNFGLPAAWAPLVAGLGYGTVGLSSGAVGDAAALPLTDGRVLFQGNQVTLTLPGRVDREGFSAVTVASLDDVDLAGNQTSCLLTRQQMLVDVFTFAITARQSGNGLSETPFGVLASLVSSGWLNGCSFNQGTHCILAFGPKQAVSGNLIFVPTALCRG